MPSIVSKFSVGDIVFVPKFKRIRKMVQCPDCFGKKSLAVTLGDGSNVSIRCDTCRPVYDDPLGCVEAWEYEATYETITIDKIEVVVSGKKSAVHYQSGTYIYEESGVFTTAHEALTAAQELRKKHEQKELERLKQKPAHMREKGWASTVRYHRQKIREAQKELKHHAAALSFAVEMANEEKEAHAR